jgi:hypothetical protein
MSIWIVLAIVAFVIAALIAFGVFSGVSVIGLVSLGLIGLSLHVGGVGPYWGSNGRR